MIQLPQAEIDLIDHCSLRCAHCTTASPYLSPRIYDLEQFKKDIDALGPVVHMARLQLLGGEPFLVPNLEKYAQVVKSNHFADTLSVLTNGLHLETASEAAIASVDFVHVTYYTHLPTPMLERVQRGIERARTINEVILTQPKTEFMSTDFHGCLDEPTLHKVWSECWQKKICTSICDGYVYRCTMGQRRQRYFERIGHKFDKSMLAREVNGCIIDAPKLEERLGRYIHNDFIPPPMCAYCIGCSGKIIPQRQMTVEEVRNPVLNTDVATLL